MTGRQRPNENTISSTESVNVPESCGPTKHRQIHMTAIKDTNRLMLRHVSNAFSPSVQLPSSHLNFNVYAFVEFTV